jgi:hypothetical protein
VIVYLVREATFGEEGVGMGFGCGFRPVRVVICWFWVKSTDDNALVREATFGGFLAAVLGLFVLFFVVSW